MSYLDVPRLHFAGTFTANPSTINNDSRNYNYNPNSTNPINIDLAWNPYGDHAWSINATVRSFVDSSGALHTSGDPLIGAAVQSYAAQVPAKLVDLDTEQQSVTRLFGLTLQVTLAGTSAFSLQGAWDDNGTLINLWPGRAPGTDDDRFGGAFQSVLERLVWQDLQSSPYLQQLQAASPNGLSARFSVYGYDASTSSPGFRTGTIVGTVGPYSPGEPKHIVAGRFLIPTQGTTAMYYAPAKLDTTRNTLTIDLGNSIQDQAPGGPPVDLGTMEAAILGSGQSTSLGPINYGAGNEAAFQETAAVFQLDLTPEQAQQAAQQPLGILLDSGPALAENTSGMYVDVDGASQYMNPGGEATSTFWATLFGAPASGVQIPLQLVPSKGNNQPTSALTFPPSVTTVANGSAPASFQASNPSPLPQSRQNIGGQLYFIGGPWAPGTSQMSTSPLTVKVFSSIDPPIPNPTWEDVQPILYKYYYLYATMVTRVDLSNYDSVAANAQAIAKVVSLPFTDPNYMPVSREMSEDQRKLILTWIAQGCPK